MSTPNIYADLIEYFHRHIPRATPSCWSLHPHNDRGCAIAAAEAFGQMAGADRVEGWPVRQRSENRQRRPWVTLALNLFSQGIDPKARTSPHRTRRSASAEYCNRLPVHPRTPTSAISCSCLLGMHRTRIKKGWQHLPRTTSSGRCRISRSTRPRGRSYEASSGSTPSPAREAWRTSWRSKHGFVLPRPPPDRVLPSPSSTSPRTPGGDLTGRDVEGLL